MLETRKKRPAAKRKHARGKPKQETKRLPLPYGQRQVLVEFLNHDFSRPLKYDRNEGFIDANGREVSGELHMIIHRDLSLGSLEHLESIRQGFIADLLPIAESPAAPFTLYQIQGYLETLTAKLNQMKFEARFVVSEGVKKDKQRGARKRGQKRFSRGLGEWRITIDFSAGAPYAPSRDFYGMIAEGLVNGELDLLRRCPYCQQFFTARQRREIFCTPQHARLYYDDPGRAKQRVYNSRGVADD
jgi:hypothetical protein